MLMVVGPVTGEAHAQPGHPERPARVAAVMEGVADLHLGDELVVVPTRPADPAELARVHTDAPSRAPGPPVRDRAEGSIDADTYATPESWDIATRAAGAGLVAIDELRQRTGASWPSWWPARPGTMRWPTGPWASA